MTSQEAAFRNAPPPPSSAPLPPNELPKREMLEAVTYMPPPSVAYVPLPDVVSDPNEEFRTTTEWAFAKSPPPQLAWRSSKETWSTTREPPVSTSTPASWSADQSRKYSPFNVMRA